MRSRSLPLIRSGISENTSFQEFMKTDCPLDNHLKPGNEVYFLCNEDSRINTPKPRHTSAEDFTDKHENLEEATLGVHPLGYVIAPEAQQDYKALMKSIPEGPKKLKHKKSSLFEAAGYITQKGNTVDSDKIDADRVNGGQVRYSLNGGLLKLELSRKPSMSQVAKLRQLIAKADSVDLDVYSNSHKDFEHYKKDRLGEVLPSITAFFDNNRLPPFQALAPLRTDVKRLDQG